MIKKKVVLFAFLALLALPEATFAQTYGDYTLYSIKGVTKAYLIDMSGNTYHSWTFNSSAPTGYSTYLLPGGIILRAVERQGNYFSGGPVCGEVQKVDWNGNVIWDFVYSTTSYCTHHDICAMPNGNVLLIAYESKTPSQVSAAGCSQSITMWPDKIVEIQPQGTNGGNVVWEWHAWDHLSQNLYLSKSNYVSSIVQHPELLNINYNAQKDWLHVNGLDYNEELNQIVFSSHYMNEFYVIDHSTTTSEAASHSGGNSGKGGDILYRWGNPSAYQASGVTNFNIIHDAHWVPGNCPKANYISGFNNKGGSGGKTCVDLVDPPYDGYIYSGTSGSAFGPATYSWRHTYSGTPTQNEGNSQQLPNGNTLVNISFSGYIYEIDSNQNKIWSKTVSGVNTSAFRYTACYVNSIGAAMASALPAGICAGSFTQLNAEGIGGSNYVYSWTSNPPGFSSSDQNPVAMPVANTTYIVTISSGSCSATDSVKVIVNPIPETPTITKSYDTLFSSAAAGNQWYLNSYSIPGATERFLIPEQNGSYQVQVTDGIGCLSEMSSPFMITGTILPAAANAVILYPNPSNGIVNLLGTESLAGDYTVSVYDCNGSRVIELQKPTAIDLSSFGNGIYYCIIHLQGGKLVSRKIQLVNQAN